MGFGDETVVGTAYRRSTLDMLIGCADLLVFMTSAVFVVVTNTDAGNVDHTRRLCIGLLTHHH